MKMVSLKRNKLEHVAVILVVMLVAFLVGANIYYQRQESRQRALYYQLQIIRSGINLFKVVNKRNPNNLVELAKNVYNFPGDMETRRYLSNVPFDKQGNLIDSFGNNFFYDPKSGWIRSSTGGYEMW